MRLGLLLALATAASSSSLPVPGTIAEPSTKAVVAAAATTLQDYRQSTVLPWLRWFRDGAVGLVWPHHRKAAPAPSLLPVAMSDAEMVVMRLDVASPEEEELLSEAVARLGIDVWAVGDYHVDIRLRRKRIPDLMKFLPSAMHDAWRLLIPDIPSAINDVLHCSACAAAPEDGVGEARSSWEDEFFETYQPLTAVNRWMDLMASMFPSFTSTIEVGQSFEGRPIRGLRISTAAATTTDVPEEDGPRKMMVIIGGMHAREWITTTTVNFVSRSFISLHLRQDRVIDDFLDDFDIVLIPALNPDGIEYSWATNRLWRKTRQPTDTDSGCQGFDLDHAFEYGWEGGSRHNHACSDSYGGALSPLEPVEARALVDWARNVTAGGKARIVSVLDLHSYSQQILYPLASTCDEPPNLENLEELAFGMAKTVRHTTGERYDVMSACEGLTSQRGWGGGDGDEHVDSDDDGPPQRRRSLVEYGGGSMVDWFFDEMGAHYSYQIKLRDTGAYGFLLPKEFIRPTGREAFSAIWYMADYLTGNNGIEKVWRPGRGRGKAAAHRAAVEEQMGEPVGEQLDDDDDDEFVVVEWADAEGMDVDEEEAAPGDDNYDDEQRDGSVHDELRRRTPFST